MLRKTILAMAAAATLGAAALAPTNASAWWGHPGWHGWYRGWAYRPAISVHVGPIYGGCFVRRWIYTPYGPVLRWVNRCN